MADNTNKLFHVVIVDERTLHETVMTSYPMPHKQCCIMMKKLSPRAKNYVVRLKEAKPFSKDQ